MKHRRRRKHHARGSDSLGEAPVELRRERGRAIATVAAILAFVAVLGVVGLGVENRLRPTSLAIPGTESERGEELASESFGESSPVAVLLRGPAGPLEQQGRELTRTLRRDPTLTVVSPWDPSPAARKLPGPVP